MITHELGSTEHLVALVKTALDNFEQTTLDGSARSALRVARLRGDADDAWMLLHDLRPTGGSDRVRAADVYQLWPEDDPATVRERQRALLEQWIAERRTTLPEPLRAELGAPTAPSLEQPAACGLRSGLQQPETLTHSGLTNGGPSAQAWVPQDRERGVGFHALDPSPPTPERPGPPIKG